MLSLSSAQADVETLGTAQLDLQLDVAVFDRSDLATVGITLPHLRSATLADQDIQKLHLPAVFRCVLPAALLAKSIFHMDTDS